MTPIKHIDIQKDVIRIDHDGFPEGWEWIVSDENKIPLVKEYLEVLMMFDDLGAGSIRRMVDRFISKLYEPKTPADSTDYCRKIFEYCREMAGEKMFTDDYIQIIFEDVEEHPYYRIYLAKEYIADISMLRPDEDWKVTSYSLYFHEGSARVSDKEFYRMLVNRNWRKHNV